MPIRLMSGIAERVILVLQDYLPAELDLIDAQVADGITTPDIAAADYYEWDATLIQEYPACSIRTVSSQPSDFEKAGVFPADFGSQVHAIHRLDVMFHVVATQGKPADLQKLMHRYINGAFRVLCIQDVSLLTIADPNEFASWTWWAEIATYGPEAEQDSGAIVRTATLPIAVRRIEIR